MHGRVQGVWFRGWVREQATARGLTGWVRNRADGTVEALFVGPPAVIDGMVAACGEGPEDARVAKVERAEAFPEQMDGVTGFVQR